MIEMKQIYEMTIAFFVMITLCGCGSDSSKNESTVVESQGFGKSVETSSIKMDESKPEAEVKVEQKEEAPDSDQLLMDYYQDEIVSKMGKIKDYELTAGYVRRDLEPVYDSEWGSFTQVDVGDYSGEEGVLAMELTDMDSDGSDEMVVFYREKDKVSDFEEKYLYFMIDPEVERQIKGFHETIGSKKFINHK